MKFPNYIAFVILLFILILSCRTGIRKDKGSHVLYFGNLDSIMAGYVPVVFHMDSLANKKNVFALGAMEGLSGEIQIFDSQSYHSQVFNDSVRVGPESTHGASLLVYAQVPEWKEIPIPLSVVNQEALVGFLEYDEQMAKISSERPLVFTIEGKAEEIEWHVLKVVEDDSIPSHGDHKKASVSGTLQDVDVEILGFYSREHEGVFTHHNLPLHLHFKTADGKMAGHLDHLELGPDMTMRIPNIK